MHTISISPQPNTSQQEAITELRTLCRMQLLLLFRRPLLRICCAILVGGFILTVGVQVIFYTMLSQPSPAQSSCVTTTADQGKSCLTMTPQQQAQQNNLRQAALRDIRNSLTFPASLGTAGGFLQFFGVLIFCILTSTFVGSEYSFGTQRLAFARGTRRSYLVLSQISVLALLSLLISGVFLVLAAIAGSIIGPLCGGYLSIPPLAFWEEFLLYWLLLAGELWVYGLLAFLFATLGSSVAAGIAGSLGYCAIQSILFPSLKLTLASFSGVPGTIAKHLTDVLLSTNATALISGFTSTPIRLSTPTPTGPSLWQAGLLVGGYALLSSILALWTLHKRDIK